MALNTSEKVPNMVLLNPIRDPIKKSQGLTELGFRVLGLRGWGFWGVRLQVQKPGSWFEGEEV